MRLIFILFIAISVMFGISSQAKTYQEKDLKERILKLGLNKKITVTEFIKNAKALNPNFKNEALEKFAQDNPQVTMPKASITTKLSGAGSVPVITLENANGDDQVIQFLGTEDAAVKVGDVKFSQSDLKNSDIIDRKLANQEEK